MIRSKNKWSFDPLIVVACLLLAHLVYGVPFTPAAGYLAIVAFAISAYLTAGRFHSSPRTDAEAASAVLIDWAVVVALLFFFAFAFKVGADFSRRVILSWFTVTPIALYAVHTVRLQTSGHN